MTNPFSNPYDTSENTTPTSGGGTSSPFTNPFDATSPTTQTPTLQPGQNILDANPYKPMSNKKAFAVGVATTIGRAIQPLAAPQQIIFGGIGAVEDLATGKGVQAAIDTFSRGAAAAGDYLTYGLTARPGVGNGVDDRNNRISGFQLAKKANLPDIIARPVGIAADFLVDVPLLGVIGKATKLGRVAGVTTDINNLAAENMARNFLKPGGVASNPADWDVQGIMKFAARVAAAPVSTAPLRDVVTAVPRGIRDQIAAKVAGAVEGARTAPVQGGRILGQNAESGKTVGQMLISRFGNIEGLPTMGGQQIRDLKQTGQLTGTGVAREVQGDIYRAQIEATNLTIKAADAQNAYKKLTDGLSQQAKDQFDDIAHRLLDWKDVTQYAKAQLDLQQFATTLGNPAFAQTAREALYKTAHLETYGGLLRYRNGTLGLDETAGYQSGLARYETDTFGQPKPVTQEVADLQQRMASRVAGFQRAGVPFVPPEGMHLRRSFQLQYNPNRQIQKVLDAQLPPQIMHIDDTKLGDAFHSWALKTNQPSPMLQQASNRLAQDFKAYYTNPAQNEPQALTSFLTGRGFTNDEAIDFINHTGRQFHQNGITYRPNYTWANGQDGVAEIIRKMADNPSATPVTLGSSSPAMGLSNKPLQSRADLPEWLMESMGQIKDIGRLLDENVRIGGKQYMNRSIVQDVYNFLKSEDAILTTPELHALPGNAGGVHSNWRAIDDTLAQRLKGMDDKFSQISKDTPFTGDTYIPAAYHDLLTTFSQVDDPGVKFAALQLLNTSFKAHKVANPAAIARDIASNFRFADDLGINPAQMSKAIGQALTLRSRAVKGSGVFDMDAAIQVGNQQIKWKDIIDHGGFVHGNFVVNEVQDSYAALRSQFANDTGSPMQRATAAFIDHADRVARARDAAAATGNVGAQIGAAVRTGGAVATDLALGLGGPVTKKLTDIKGDIDTIFKMATYIHKRGRGMDSEKAAQYADELFFNYANQPIVVDFLRKNGISPFAAFQFMASGRFIKTMYQNPYAIEKYYRLPESLSDGDNQAKGEMKYTMPKYMQRDLWVPMPGAKGGSVRDSQNRLMMFNLATVMPESALFDFFSGDAISNWVPPYVSLMQQVVTGQGYGGVPLFAGGKNAGDTFSQDPTEWARGVVKALHMYGAVPYAPGSPSADRMAKAIVAAAVPADQIAGNKLVQGYMKYASNGAFAAPFDRFPTVPQGLRQQAPTDVPYAALRNIGVTSTPITGTMNQPGSALSNMQTLNGQRLNIQNIMRQRIRAAGGDEATIKAVVDEYMPQLLNIGKRAQEAVDFEEKFATPYYRKDKAAPVVPTTNPFR